MDQTVPTLGAEACATHSNTQGVTLQAPQQRTATTSQPHCAHATRTCSRSAAGEVYWRSGQTADAHRAPHWQQALRGESRLALRDAAVCRHSWGALHGCPCCLGSRVARTVCERTPRWWAALVYRLSRGAQASCSLGWGCTLAVWMAASEWGVCKRGMA